MVSIAVSLDEETISKIKLFPWVNWSEVGREESIKKELFDKYVKTGKLSDKDWEFCDKIDWIPGDWLPLKEEFVKELKKARKEPSIPMTLEKLDKLMGLK